VVTVAFDYIPNSWTASYSVCGSGSGKPKSKCSKH